MADFKTHVTTSSIVGLGYGGAGFAVAGMTVPDSILAATFCGAAGMLPDIDSGPGRPLREITTLLAVMVPSMLLIRMHDMLVDQSWRILIALVLYVAIRFGLRTLLKRYTVHRGMFHSLVTVAIFGELAFLLMYGEETIVRCFIAGGVVAGALSHLILDEIYSVDWKGRPHLKSSFGTAVKVFGKGWWPNISAYGKLTLLTAVVIYEPGLFQVLRNGQVRERVRELTADYRLRSPESEETAATAIESSSPPVDQSPASWMAGAASNGQATEPPLASPWGHQPTPPRTAEPQPIQPVYQRAGNGSTYPAATLPPSYRPASSPRTYPPALPEPPVDVPTRRRY